MADSSVHRAECSSDRRSVYIHDCRPESKISSEKVIEISDRSFDEFLQAVRKVGGPRQVQASNLASWLNQLLPGAHQHLSVCCLS